MCDINCGTSQQFLTSREFFTSEQLKDFTLDTGAFGSDWRGASLTKYFEMCRMDSSALGVDNSHVFIFQWC